MSKRRYERGCHEVGIPGFVNEARSSAAAENAWFPYNTVETAKGPRIEAVRIAALLLAVWMSLMAAASARAGLYNTAEPPVVLEPNVEKFLRKLSELRGFAPSLSLGMRGTTKQREDYLRKVKELRAKPNPSPQDLANLGAYLIRLQMTDDRGSPLQEASDVLEAAARQFRDNFYLQANSGTLHQMMGNLDLAATSLEMAEGL